VANKIAASRTASSAISVPAGRLTPASHTTSTVSTGGAIYPDGYVPGG